MLSHFLCKIYFSLSSLSSLFYFISIGPSLCQLQNIFFYISHYPHFLSFNLSLLTLAL